jgi:hypothetical protein
MLSPACLWGLAGNLDAYFPLHASVTQTKIAIRSGKDGRMLKLQKQDDDLIHPSYLKMQDSGSLGITTVQSPIRCILKIEFIGENKYLSHKKIQLNN